MLIDLVLLNTLASLSVGIVAGALASQVDVGDLAALPGKLLRKLGRGLKSLGLLLLSGLKRLGKLLLSVPVLLVAVGSMLLGLLALGAKKKAKKKLVKKPDLVKAASEKRVAVSMKKADTVRKGVSKKHSGKKKK